LIELLVVVGIIVLLVAILLPSLSRARAQTQAVACRSNLRQIGMGLVLYSGANKDYAVPSYNLPWAPGATTNYTGGPDQALDGWGPILDRDRFVPTNQRDTNSAFFCPNTVDVEGMKDGQTGDDPDKPRGWTDWPLRFTSVGGDSAPKEAVTIPERRLNKIIRVSYWINAYNPVGNKPADIASADLHYTASVGLGPDAKGEYIKLHKMSLFRPSPCLFVVVADGIYMGRQGVTQQFNTNSRIGYRHPGVKNPFGAANIILADGHVEAMQGDRFPRALGASDAAEVVAAKRHENLSGPTIYANPKKVFP
jgi:prepilin-type processing-associated H-X9-DG protein